MHHYGRDARAQPPGLLVRGVVVVATLLAAPVALAAAAGEPPAVLGSPVDFILFALTLLGVPLSNMYPQAKNVGRWLYHGWHVTVAYVFGFCVLRALLGWQPTPKRGDPPLAAPAALQPAEAARP